MNYRRILVSHDGTEHGDNALVEAAGLARASGARLIVSACAAIEDGRCCAPGARAVWNDFLREDAGRRLERSALLVGDTCQTEVVLLEGDPPLALARAASALDCDLVVLPAGPRGRLRRWFRRDAERTLRRRGYAVRRAGPMPD